MRDRRGAVAIEFALVLPLLLLLAIGTHGIGSLLRTYAAVNRLAMQYAISYADCSDTLSGACLGELSEYGSAATLGNIVPQLNAANLSLSMAQVAVAGSVAAVEYGYPNGLSLSVAQQAAVQAVVASGQAGVVVTATYKYQVPLFAAILSPIIGSGVTITYTVAQLK